MKSVAPSSGFAAPVALGIPKKQLLRTCDVCKRLSISRQTLWRLRRRDTSFPRPIKILSKEDRYDAQQIDAWVAAKEAGNA